MHALGVPSFLRKLKMSGYESKVYLCLSLLVLSFLPVLFGTFLSLHELVFRQKETVRMVADDLIYAERLSRESAGQFSIVPLYILSGDPSLLTRLTESRQKFAQVLAKLRTISQSPSDQALLDKIENLQHSHSAFTGPGFALRQKGVPPEVVHRYFEQKSQPIGVQLLAAIDQYVQNKNAELRAARAEEDATTERIIDILRAVSVCALLFVALITALLVRLVREKRRADLDQERLFLQERNISQIRKQTVEMVSHDLKNPLAALKLRLQVLSRRQNSPETTRDVQLALKAIHAMEKLINDLLDHTKIEAGNLALEKSRCDLPALARELTERLEPLAREKSISLSVNVDGPLPPVSCDPGRVGQVLGNLVGNALKFTGTGGEVRVQATTRGGEAVFCVRDTGPGIDPKKLDHIFDRFWQDEKTAKQGTGLGLAIAKGIVDAHGGKIWAESAPGQGTGVYFSLPL